MNSDAIKVGDVAYDAKTRTLVNEDGGAVQLRHKSKEVLSFLVNNPDRTISKSEIMDSIWTDVAVSDESLVQCIAEIRRVIGKDARQIVETIPREGYRLNLPTDAQRQHVSPVLPVVITVAVLTLALILWTYSVEVQPVPMTSPNETLRATPPGTAITEAYLEVLQGSISAGRFDPDESLIAERHFRRAIELDPTYARAYAELGTLFAVRFENDWTVLQEADKEKALFYAEKAVALDPELGAAHYALGRLHSVLSNLDAAEEHLERAMSLEPDNEDARAYYGIVRNFRGDAEGAIAILRPALASHPNPPFWYFFGLGNAEFNAGNLQQAADALNTCLDLAEDSPYCLRYLIAVYGMMGRVDDAQASSHVYASMGFERSVNAIMGLMTMLTPEDRALLRKALRLAGLPE